MQFIRAYLKGIEQEGKMAHCILETNCLRLRQKERIYVFAVRIEGLKLTVSQEIKFIPVLN
jgi:hypothetical protein